MDDVCGLPQIFSVGGNGSVWLGMQGGVDALGKARSDAIAAATTPQPSINATATATAPVPSAPPAVPSRDTGIADKPFGCPYCTKAFTTAVNLTRHVTKDHGSSDGSGVSAGAGAGAVKVPPPPAEVAVEADAVIGNVELLNLTFTSFTAAAPASSELAVDATLSGLFHAAVHSVLEIERMVKSNSMRCAAR